MFRYSFMTLSFYFLFDKNHFFGGGFERSLKLSQIGGNLARKNTWGCTSTV